MDKELMDELMSQALGGDKRSGTFWYVRPDELAKFAALVAEECIREFSEKRDVINAVTHRSGSAVLLEMASEAIRAKFPLPGVKP